jgi:hypothetical protein
MQDLRGRHLFQERGSRRAIGYLAAGQQERDGPAITVGQRVNLGCPSAARATDGLTVLPPFAPEAKR